MGHGRYSIYSRMDMSKASGISTCILNMIFVFLYLHLYDTWIYIYMHVYGIQLPKTLAHQLPHSTRWASPKTPRRHRSHEPCWEPGVYWWHPGRSGLRLVLGAKFHKQNGFGGWFDVGCLLVTSLFCCHDIYVCLQVSHTHMHIQYLHTQHAQMYDVVKQ